MDIPPHLVADLLGPTDSNLRALEKVLSAGIHIRGSRVTIAGTAGEVAAAQAVIGELVQLAEAGTDITPESVRTIAAIGVTSAPQESAAQVLSHHILSHRGRAVRPKSVNQKRYVDAIDENTVVFGIGPAGTGKTYLAVAKAVQALESKKVSRIILTRPAVEAGERLGFLPGSLNDKIDPYLRPLYDALADMMEAEAVPKLISAGVIEVAPLAYMRGRTLNNAFIILDEAQNTTPAQMKMFLTRLGFDSTIVVTGDLTQRDLPPGQASGLQVVREILADIDDIAFLEFASEDVVRHRLVADIVAAYGEYDEAQDRAERAAQGQSGRTRSVHTQLGRHSS